MFLYRILSYDRAGNVANAIPALEFSGQQLKWHRLDDGVMGGKSETIHHASSNDGQEVLKFTGNINTNGGGFASIRAILPTSLSDTKYVTIKFKGDGKTYKMLLADGSDASGGPWAKKPTWQADIPTEKRINDKESNYQEIKLSLETDFKPSFGGKAVPKQDLEKYSLDPSDIKMIGIMLSLVKSDGSPNPQETFGTGVFEFNLDISSITVDTN